MLLQMFHAIVAGSNRVLKVYGLLTSFALQMNVFDLNIARHPDNVGRFACAFASSATKPSQYAARATLAAASGTDDP